MFQDNVARRVYCFSTPCIILFVQPKHWLFLFPSQPQAEENLKPNSSGCFCILVYKHRQQFCR